MSGQFKGIIFDMDGTLLDTLGDAEYCMNLVLRRHGLPSLDREFYGGAVHEGDENFVRMVLSKFGEVDGLAARVLSEFRAEYESHYDVLTRPFDQVCELLDTVRDFGLRMAVLSNKRDPMVKNLAKKMFPRVGFGEIIGIIRKDDRKPDPGNALRIASSFAVHPSEIILLGDSRVDMKTAVAAGMLPAGALWGYGSAEELREGGAQVMIERPLDLLPHLK